MHKPSGNRIRVESWNVVANDKKVHPEGRRIVTKVAVRNPLGQFHGATNFRGSVIGG